MPLFGKPVVHLDLKDFIELAKEVKAKTPIQLDRLVRLNDQGKIVVAASGMVMFEVFGIKDPKQRLAIGEVMARLSKTFVVRPFDDVQNMEVTNAVAEHFGAQGRFDMSLMVFGVGYLEAVGHVKLLPPPAAAEEPDLYAEVEAACFKELLKEDILERMFSALQIPKIEEGGKEHQTIIDAVERTRQKWADKSFQQHERDCVLDLVESVTKRFDRIAMDLGILVNGLHPLLPDLFRSREFLTSLPTLNTWAKLHLYLLHKDNTKEFKVNHLYDIAQLAVAIPYCDVVVCDKEMTSVIKQSKLDKLYNTLIFPKMSEALDWLEKHADEPEDNPSTGK